MVAHAGPIWKPLKSFLSLWGSRMRSKAALLVIALLAAEAHAEDKTLSFPQLVTFETGDTWTHADQTFRLYGVQSCLRGTLYTAPNGQTHDCGLISIAALAAVFSTGTVGCQPVGSARDGAIFVVCGAQIGGATVDIGTALISTGSAFAAELPTRIAVSAPYAIAELTAKRSRRGLWVGRFSHPVNLLMDPH